MPDLSSPPLPLSDRILKTSVEKLEVKADITPHTEHIKRDKTETKPKEATPKTSKVSCN